MNERPIGAVRQAGAGAHYGYVDAARGIAILSVIAVHASQPMARELNPLVRLVLNAGQFGVQLFFVVSAFTLCLSWASQRASQSSASGGGARFLRFLVRRFFRIAPLYYLGIVIYGLAANAGIHGAADYTFENVISNVFFVHGLLPPPQWRHESVAGVVPGGWSIGTEMCFYLIFPAVFAGVVPLGRRWRWVVPTIAVTFALGAAWLWPARTSADTTFRFHHLALQLPVFLFGFWVFCRVADRLLTLLPLGLICLLIGFALLPSKTGLPLLTGTVAAGVLMLLSRWASPWPWLMRIGEMSFSLYVLHFLFAWWGGKVLTEVVHPAWLAFALTYVLAVAGSCALAALTYRYVEVPFMDLGRSLGACVRRRSGLA